MEGFFRRFKNLLVLMVVVILQVIALATQINRPNYGRHADSSKTRAFRLTAHELIAPPEKLLSRMGGGIRNLWNGYIDLRHTREQNRDLQKRLGEIRLHEAAMAEDARQGQRLRALLEFRQQYTQHTVAAQVIGNSSSDTSRVLTLDKGSNSGLKPDMAVITPDGIVGKLRNVTPNTSELLLINDTSSGVGIVLENTRIRTVLHGSPNGIVEITSLLPDTRIKPGDHIVTSGGDMVYPRGLNVGVVESSSQDPDHQPYARIVVHPTAQLERLEEVLVITDTVDHLANQPTDPNEPKSTAEVLGERLPGLHDKEPTPDPTQPVTKDLPPPHPKQALHSDIYSPGTTPSAESLTPGQQHTESK